MNMPKRFLLTIILAGAAFAGYAQVNQKEMEDLPPVTFMNYEGPNDRIDTREQIRQIGVGLGQRIAGNLARAGAAGRYFVIHSVSAAEGSKIDADIFGLGVDAGVDHIRNLRTIIQGYLQAAYGYNAQDAALLAEYITIYNAVYRGSWDYFAGRYKTQVIGFLEKEKAGLSIRYDEWPGRTLMLIPLGYGGLSSIDTTVISDSRVIEELRKEDDEGVQQRRDMTDLKEREAAEAEQKAQTEREAIKQEEERITQERQQVQQDKESGKITEEEAKQRQEELDKEEESLEERRDTVEKLEEFAEKKTEEAQQDRQEIAEEQTVAIIQSITGGVIGVILDTKNPQMGSIVRFDQSTGREIKRSPMDSVRTRTVTFINERILAIAGSSKGNAAIRLVEVNQDSLEMAKQGDDDLEEDSLIWVNGTDLYAIAIDLKDKSCYLARFNTNLARQAKSTVKTHPKASVAFFEGRLLTQREDGSALALNPQDLTETR
ncbi:MAG: hypothetical protein LBU82_02435 [Treponema sp.]|jgi:hypothetical protein|nr:hypothetical protein [Treponema sp.]